MEKAQEKNILDKYSSNIKHILIPLPNFRHYHQTESETIKDDEGFIGRRAIISMLKSWLINKDTLTGAYLITGFRGMGKSSTVGKALNELTRHYRYIKERYFQIIKGAVILFTCFWCGWERYVNEMNIQRSLAFITVIAILGGIVLYVLHRKALWNYKHKVDRKRKINNGQYDTEYIPVRINVGNELLTHNDEILRLIVKNVYDTFTDYVRRPAKHLRLSYAVVCLQLLCIWGIMMYARFLTIPDNDYANINGNLRGLNGALVNFSQIYPSLSILIGCLACYYLSNFLIRKISLLIDRAHIGFITFEGIKEQLNVLYLRSIASIDEDYSSVMRYLPAIFKKKKYEKATLREMEQGLIAVFEKIDELRNCMIHFDLRFIIVLDELDKVETSIDDSSVNREVPPAYETSINGFPGTLNARKRKQELMRTLANMKYFLSTVKAKFIFIAGRELYDAYLADVSDREFSISSIFDGVINVNSFFKSGNYTMDITGMTEEYVCRKLMPPNKKEKYTLKEYYRYLCKKTPEKKDRNARNVMFLYQYILYLAHLSNGSPKKIAVYFEKDIRTRAYLKTMKNFNLEEEDCDYYLSFGVKDIQKVCFLYYISYPIMQAMVSKSKIYEDKLLVSTSFMISHLYKYHNTGFSWRNLEHIPELLDMNKTPELRDFLGTIIAFLRQTNLSPIQSGLYLFKFPMKISEEISFIAKRAEEVSAMFHFSKDDSLPIKKHYIRLLDYYTEKRNKINNSELYALASIHHILGDIYQADEDYSQAIYEFETGLQLLSRQLKGNQYDKDAHWISYMLFLVRNMLKLGIAYEKRKTFDSAYLAYNELEKRLVEYREFNENELELKYNFEWNDDSLAEKDAILYHLSKCDDSGNERPECAPLDEWDDKKAQKCNYAFPANQIGSEFSNILSPVRFSVLIRQSFFYDLRLAYLPTLAKLFVLEKMDTEGITVANVDLAEAEFFYLHVFVNDTDKPMIYADFFQKLGDILYYKNGLVGQHNNNLFQALAFNGFNLKRMIEKISREKITGSSYYQRRRNLYRLCQESNAVLRLDSCLDISHIAEVICGNISRTYSSEDKSRVERILAELKINQYDDSRLTGCLKHRENFLENGKRLPCYACKYYHMSLDAILTNILHYSIDKHSSKSVNIMVWLIDNREKLLGFNEVSLLLMANTMKGLANVMMSCSDNENCLSDGFLQKLLNSFEVYYGRVEKENTHLLFGENDNGLDALEKAILLYMESGIFFDQAGYKNNAAQMFRQIVEVMNAYLRICHMLACRQDKDRRIGILKNHLDGIRKIVQQIIILLYGYCDSVNMLQIDKFKSLYNSYVDTNIKFHHVPFSPDIEELIYRYYFLEIGCGKTECITKLYKSYLMGGYKKVSTLTQDIQNLRFKLVLNEEILAQIIGIRRKKALNYGYDPFIRKLDAYFKEDKVYEQLTAYGIEVSEKSFKAKIDILNFFIIDNLACLSKISNILQPLNNSTLFASYFLGDINCYTAFWKRIYDGLYMLYKSADNWSITGRFAGNGEKSGDKLEEYIQTPGYQELCRFLAVHNIGGPLAKGLRNYLEKTVHEASAERLAWSYNAELAIQNYGKSLEMNTEGRAYKEMVSALYFLDDDLNNDTIQQQLAVERYLINAGDIKKRISLAQSLLGQSTIYQLEKYI